MTDTEQRHQLKQGRLLSCVKDVKWDKVVPRRQRTQGSTLYVKGHKEVLYAPKWYAL